MLRFDIESALRWERLIYKLSDPFLGRGGEGRGWAAKDTRRDTVLVYYSCYHTVPPFYQTGGSSIVSRT